MAQQQRGLGHHRGRLGPGITLNRQMVEDRAGRRHHPARGQRVDRDVVVVQLGGQAGGEPLQRRLAHPVHGAAAQRPAGRHGRMAGRPRGDVQDPARAPGPQARQDQRGQVERRLDLDREHERVPLRSELLHRREIRDRRVADQDVGRPEPRGGLLHQPDPVIGPRQVGRDRHRRAARLADLGHGLVDGAGKGGRRAVRGPRRHRHGRPRRAEPPCDLRPDSAARPGHQGHLPVHDTHKDIFTERSVVPAAGSPAAGPASAAGGSQ
jgi:hypothetical protein